MSQLEIGVEGRLGVIRLNRPEAINALSREMITGIRAQLDSWNADETVRAVLFEGRGPKGFCSGGDVRAVRDAVLAGRPDAFDFFDDEYAMNGEIARYHRPVVALCDGIVMGGGIGIAGHCDFRFATATARFAMPESAIGLFGDVGVNAILAQAPLPRALLFLMTGLPVGPADALKLGLTDCVIPPDRMEAVRSAIVRAADAEAVDRALVAAMQADGIDPGDAMLCADADLAADCFAVPEAAAIVAALTAASVTDPRYARYAETLAKRSPTSLEAIVRSHRAARDSGDLDATLRNEARLARHIAARPDFAEGVRAVLVDRDQRPRWSPADFGGVDGEAIERIVRA